MVVAFVKIMDTTNIRMEHLLSRGDFSAESCAKITAACQAIRRELKCNPSILRSIFRKVNFAHLPAPQAPEDAEPAIDDIAGRVTQPRCLESFARRSRFRR